jgi:peptide/nickel transport system substrate-binding protein
MTLALLRGAIALILLMTACAAPPAAPAPTAAPPAATVSSAAPKPTAPPAPAATTAAAPVSANPTSAPAAATRTGTLNVGTTTEPTSLDPTRETALSSFLVIEQMYDTLLTFDGKLNFVPSLADSWTVAPDSQSITFKLHPGVKFHNGRTLTSADVKYSIDALRAQGAINAGLYSNIKEIATPDDLTVVFSMTDPAPYDLLSLLAVMPSTIMAQDMVNAATDLKRADAGTGPFTFGTWQNGSEITLKANPDYWRPGMPSVNELDFKIVPDETSALAALRSGDIDWFQFNDAAVFDQIKNDSSLTTNQAPFLAYNYASMNATKPPFNDVRVRQAVSYALDRQQIIDIALEGLGDQTGPIVPAQSVALPVSQFPSYAQSTTTAKQLLDAAGSGNGFDTTLELISTDAAMNAAAPVLVDQLAKVGIRVKLVPEESAVWLDHLTKVTYPGMIMGSSSGNPNPNLPLFNSFTCSGPWNYSGFCDQAYDDLQKQVRVATNDTRTQLLQQVQLKIANDYVPYTYLFVRKQLFAWRNAVKGFTPRPWASKAFWEVSVQK